MSERGQLPTGKIVRVTSDGVHGWTEGKCDSRYHSLVPTLGVLARLFRGKSQTLCPRLDGMT